MYSEYKANRSEAPEDFKIQLQDILDIAKAIRIPMFVPKDAEADDAIASIVEKYKKENLEILIVSGDKDLYGLLYKNVKMLKAKKGVSDFVQIDADFVKEDWDIHYTKTVDFLAISGDSADNIPGVKGVGPKGASKLLNQYGSLEEIYKHIEEIQPEGIKKKLTESKDNAFLSQKLVRLKADIPLEQPFEEWSTDVFLNSDDASLDIFKEKELNVVYQDWRKLTGSEPPRESNIGKHTRIIRSQKEWEEVYAILKKEKFAAIDTETTDTSPMKAKLVGLSVAWKKLKESSKENDHEEYFSAYIPCVFEPADSSKQADLFAEDHDHDHDQDEKSEQDLFSSLETTHSDYETIPKGTEVLKWLKPFLEDGTVKKAGQNIKYDWLVLKRHGIDLQGVSSDTMLISFLLKPGQRRHNLDDMALDHLGHVTIKYKDLVGSGKKQKPLVSVPLNALADYACEDAEVTLRLNDILLPLMIKEGFNDIYQNIDLPLVYTLIRMEENGVALDIPYLSEMAEQYKSKIEKIKKEIFELAGEEFNIQSTQELRGILFEKLGIESDKKTEKGQLSTDHQTLERLWGEHPIIQHLLDFRLISKLLSTYVLPLPQYVHKETKKVHTSFSQVTAATARLASNEPNLQNIPIKGDEGRAIRKAFIPSQGYELLSLDYSQIELRVLAHYSEDENLIKAYKEDQDIHDQAAYLLFHNYFDVENRKWNFPDTFENNESENASNDKSSLRYDEQFDPDKLKLMKATHNFQDLRGKAKVLNFSIIYGVTDWGLSQQLNISRQEARSLIQAYLSTYPGVEKYMKEVIRTTKEKGYSENFFGRKRRISDLDHHNRFKREAAERLAMNTPIQSTAADIIKVSMINIQRELDKKKSKSKMLLQIHDELLFEVASSERDGIFNMVKDKMENAVSLKVPLKVSGGFGKNWDEAK